MQILISKDEIVVPLAKPANNEIWYAGYVSVDESQSMTTFGANIISDELNQATGRGVITFDRNITKIGDWAFEFCTSLTSVTIGDSVTTIGDSAFYSCDSLTSVYCKAVTPPALGGNRVFYNNGSDHKIYVPAGSVNAYKSAANWSEYANKIVSYNF